MPIPGEVWRQFMLQLERFPKPRISLAGTKECLYFSKLTITITIATTSGLMVWDQNIVPEQMLTFSKTMEVPRLPKLWDQIIKSPGIPLQLFTVYFT